MVVLPNSMFLQLPQLDSRSNLQSHSSYASGDTSLISIRPIQLIPACFDWVYVYHLNPMADTRPVGVCRYTPIAARTRNSVGFHLHPRISPYAHIRTNNEAATALIPLVGYEVGYVSEK
jgi:hypothetical protein